MKKPKPEHYAALTPLAYVIDVKNYERWRAETAIEALEQIASDQQRLFNCHIHGKLFCASCHAAEALAQLNGSENS
jgi:hypothetical protein